MTEREAIESTYYDKVSSYRRINVKDDVTKQTRQEEQQIISAAPCALSRNSLKPLAFGENHGEINAEYTLFHAPELDIKAGDKLVVNTSQGQTFECYAGKPFAYSSHAETKCSEREPA